MANKLMSLFRSAMQSEKNPSKEAIFDIMYSTGFANIDYLNGTMVHVNGNGIEMEYPSLGVVDGSSNMFISRPGGGKSTLIDQIVGYQLRKYPDSALYIDDIENSLPTARKEYILGMDKQDIKDRVFIRNVGITTENVYAQIRKIWEIKTTNRGDYEYDTGLYDTEGNRIFKLIPTFYIIDSFAMLLPNDINDEVEMEGSKNDAMSSAKKSTMFIKKIAQLIKEANIVMYTVNHIMDNPQMGPFVKASQVEGLKPDERLPGGKTSLYLANNMFRLDKDKTLKETEYFGIPCTVIKFTICKSRTNSNMRSIPLVFDKSKGIYDNELSTFWYLKENGYVGGVGRGLYFEDFPTVKFSMKEFKERLTTDEDLRKAFVLTAKKGLTALLSDTSAEIVASKVFDISDYLNAELAG